MMGLNVMEGVFPIWFHHQLRNEDKTIPSQVMYGRLCSPPRTANLVPEIACYSSGKHPVRRTLQRELLDMPLKDNPVKAPTHLPQ